MALTTKLMLRQGQSLVMTPQLLQAIKLLQFSNLELAAFVQEELERNPLLERADEVGEAGDAPTSGASDGETAGPEASIAGEFNDAQEVEWSSQSFATDRASLEASLGTELSNAFEDDRAATPGEMRPSDELGGLSATSWSGSAGPSGDGEAANLEAYVAAQVSLKDHLAEQLMLATSDAVDRIIGHAIIDAIDENGYFTEDLGEIAARLATAPARTKISCGSCRASIPRASAHAISPSASRSSCARRTVTIRRCRSSSAVSISWRAATSPRCADCAMSMTRTSPR